MAGYVKSYGKTSNFFSRTGRKISNKIKTGYENAKAKVKEKATAYKDNLSVCYDVGYTSGKSDYKKLPKVAGGYKTAAVGYHRSLKDMEKADKFNNRVNKTRR